MKHLLSLTILSLLLIPSAFAQAEKEGWKEMDLFHTYMAATFHPADEGNLQPLKAKADSLYLVARLWQASAIPSDFKTAETKLALNNLVSKCAVIKKMVTAKAANSQLKKELTAAHEVFHHIMGECRKGE